MSKDKEPSEQKPLRHAKLKLTAEIYEPDETGTLLATGEIVELVDHDKAATVMELQDSTQYVIITKEC